MSIIKPLIRVAINEGLGKVSYNFLRFMIHMVAMTVITTPRRKLRVSSPANSRLDRRPGTGAGHTGSGAGVGVVRLK